MSAEYTPEQAIEYLNRKSTLNIGAVEANYIVVQTIKRLQAENEKLKEQGDVMWEGLNSQVAELQAEIAQLKEVIPQTITTLKHASVFISSRQKMHKLGRKQYQENIKILEQALTLPVRR